MSTVSLMPVGKKIKGSKHTVMEVVNKLSTATNIEEAGMLIDKKLIIDPDTVIRVDAFSASVSEKSYPSVKVSIFPTGGRMGQLYVDLSSLDGLTWEIVEEKQKEPPKPVRRIEVEFYPASSTDVCWHEAFGREYYDIHSPVWKVVNPLALTKEEIDRKSFVYSRSTNAGKAVVKKDGETFIYELAYNVKHHFKLTIDRGEEQGLLIGKYNYMTVSLMIKQRTFSSGEEWVELLEESRQTDIDHTQLIRDYLKKKHGF